MPKQELIYIGKIIGVFGIKGELKVYSESDFIDYRYRVGATIILKSRTLETPCKITSFRIHKNTILIKINDINDINLVEKYIGCLVYASKEDIPTLDEDEYYIDDLVGLDVLDENSQKIGIINDFIEVPQGYIMEIVNENKKTLIPFVDEYILEITNDYVKIKVIELCQ